MFANGFHSTSWRAASPGPDPIDPLSSALMADGSSAKVSFGKSLSRRASAQRHAGASLLSRARVPAGNSQLPDDAGLLVLAQPPQALLTSVGSQTAH
jgi:hypothetical protein